jgi:hypothetical protein
MSGKAILPTGLIPVIDVLAEDDNVGFRYGLGFFKAGE